jgi:hypothetical protein
VKQLEVILYNIYTYKTALRARTMNKAQETVSASVKREFNVSSTPPPKASKKLTMRRRPEGPGLKLGGSSDEDAQGQAPDGKAKVYQCLMCPDDPPYAGASGLWYHMKRHHGARTRPYNKRKDEKVKSVKKSAKKKKKKKKSAKKGKKSEKGKKKGPTTPKKSSSKKSAKRTPTRKPKLKLPKSLVGSKRRREPEAGQEDDDDSSSDSDSSSDEAEAADQGTPTITRNSDLMDLMRQKWQNSTDPFLLLAEVAECVTPRKRKKIKEAAKSLKFRLNEDEVNSAGAAQEAKGDDIGAFPKRPYFTSMIATQ